MCERDGREKDKDTGPNKGLQIEACSNKETVTQPLPNKMNKWVNEIAGLLKL